MTPVHRMSKQTMTDTKSKIRELVMKINPVDAAEAEHINDAVRWIESTNDIFRLQKPDIPPKHLVSYAVLLDVPNKKVLLMDHINAELWLPCGGHVEPGEHPKNAALRELKEELNLEAKLIKDEPLFITITETVGRTSGHTDVSLWYAVGGNSADEVKFDESEFKGARWFEFDEILNGDPRSFDPHIMRFIKKAVQLLRES